MQRHAAVIRLREEHAEEYLRLHRDVWPAVFDRLRESNMHNFSIFLRDGLLFSYLEYVGDDYEADTAAIAGDAETKRWWTFTDPCQQPVSSAAEGEWWAPMEEVFHTD